MFRTLKLSTRVLLVGFLPVVCFSGLLIWAQSRVADWVYEAKTEQTKHLVETAWTLLDFYGAQSRNGSITTEQAQAAAKAAVGRLSLRRQRVLLDQRSRTQDDQAPHRPVSGRKGLVLLRRSERDSIVRQDG
jgi:hypothetical protein